MIKSKSGWHRGWKTLVWVTLTMGLAGCPSSPPVGTTVTVERIVSGNTLEVSGDRSTSETVRLIGIAAPSEEQKPWGREVKDYLENRLDQQAVTLELDRETEDSYGRILAYVWLDGELINEELVKEGYVLAQEWFPNTQYSQRLQYAEQRARTLGLGIWNPEKPMRLTPSEFRRRQ
ncbi:thermonuclease family protein [Roseofilum capinflatum]|uniref:Thermonuclease family protein n=1 Tax=Roseofilum capinflatum BLCC-M114 TaxID=3022440 RepID=A0ABT7B5N1_9CYAN|nr:thermonuclease family protein [Roseofilum capinflatum]MDJ1173841.1 thermonuclease family protein [Roseofilum capinflatum BLCC-M114]